jgi:hypothetical protein
LISIHISLAVTGWTDQSAKRALLWYICSLQDNNRLFIVLEFCAGGDLGHYIKRYRQVSEATARYFLQQLAEGLKELRRHNVIHVSTLSCLPLTCHAALALCGCRGAASIVLQV